MEKTTAYDIAFIPPYRFQISPQTASNVHIATIETNNVLPIVYMIMAIYTKNVKLHNERFSKYNMFNSSGCSDPNLLISQPLNYFCIDRINGRLYTTETFKYIKLSSASSYKLIVRAYQSSRVYRDQTYSIDVMKSFRRTSQLHSRRKRQTETSLKDLLFRTNPVITKMPRFLGDDLVISGCNVSFKVDSQLLSFRLDHFFFLKDNITEIDVELISKVDGHIVIGDIVMSNVNDSASGEYKCAVGNSKSNENVYSDSVVIPKLNEHPSPYIKNISTPVLKTNQLGYRVLEGCHYRSIYNLSLRSYWLVNGTIILQINETPANIDNSYLLLNDELLTTSFSNWKLPDLSVTYYGRYQCVFKINETLNLSKESKIVGQISPRFLTSPEIIGQNITLGESISIRGCFFQTFVYKIQNADVFYIRNDKTVIPATVSSTENRFSNLDITSTTTLYQGFYQCVIFKQGFSLNEVRSNMVHIQFENLAESLVTLTINSEWSPEYSNISSSQFTSLNHIVREEITKIFTAKDKSNINKLQIDTVTFTNVSNSVFKARIRILHVNVTANERLNYCKSITSYLEIRDLARLNVTKVHVLSLDCCTANSFGDVAFKGVYDYNITLAKTSVTYACKYNEQVKFERKCESNLLKGPQWLFADLDQCKSQSKTTDVLEDISMTTICSSSNQTNCTTVADVAEDLKNVTSIGTIKIPQDVTLVSDAVSNIIENIDGANITETTNILSDVLASFNNVLDVNVNLIGKAQLQNDSSNKLVRNLDKVANIIANSLRSKNSSMPITIIKSNIAFSAALNLGKKNVSIIAKVSKDIVANITIDNNQNQGIIMESDINVLVKIPGETFATETEIVKTFLHKNTSLFLPSSQLNDVAGIKSSENPQVVQSNVLSVSISTKKLENLAKPISLTFRKVFNKNAVGTNVCSFWRFDLPTSIPGSFGGWSSKGCRQVNTTTREDFVECECDHLTNFALLLDVSQTVNNPLELQIVTWIGCGISIASLAFTILTLILFRSALLSKNPQKILLSLSTSLILLLIIFLAGAEATSSRIGCQIIAGLLHYFILTTFFWMFIEGCSLYRSFIKVFRTGSETKFFIKSSIFAWGIPLIIVAITAGIKPEKYGNNRVCIIHGLPFYFGVLLPVAAIIGFNFILLFLVMRVLVDSSKKKGNDNFATIRIAFACNVIIGITWVFAVFAVGDATSVFQWLFCIFNSLQGFFIFVFYIARSTAVQNEWLRFVGKEPRSSVTNTDKSRKSKTMQTMSSTT